MIVPFSGSDGTCPHCVRGNTNLCDSFMIPGETYSGGYAEYVAVPIAERNVVTIPDEICFRDAAALGCRFMTAFHGLVDQAKIQVGEWIVIYGCGGVGLSAINIANAMGAVHTINGRQVNPINGVMEITIGMPAHRYKYMLPLS